MQSDSLWGKQSAKIHSFLRDGLPTILYLNPPFCYRCLSLD